MFQMAHQHTDILKHITADIYANSDIEYQCNQLWTPTPTISWDCRQWCPSVKHLQRLHLNREKLFEDTFLFNSAISFADFIVGNILTSKLMNIEQLKNVIYFSLRLNK